MGSLTEVEQPDPKEKKGGGAKKQDKIEALPVSRLLPQSVVGLGEGPRGPRIQLVKGL